MVFGIGEGKVVVTLPKNIYAPGETIRGKARLELNAPKQARALRLDLYREEVHHTGKGSSTRKIVEFSKPLSGEKLYGSGEEFEFELVAPLGASTLNLPASPISGIISTLAALAVPAPRYFVSVALDLQMSLDISGRVQIQIQAPAQPAQNAQPQGAQQNAV